MRRDIADSSSVRIDDISTLEQRIDQHISRISNMKSKLPMDAPGQRHIYIYMYIEREKERGCLFR